MLYFFVLSGLFNVHVALNFFNKLWMFQTVCPQESLHEQTWIVEIRIFCRIIGTVLKYIFHTKFCYLTKRGKEDIYQDKNYYNP